MSYSLTLVLDLEKDLSNWRAAYNRSSHGVIWKKKMDPQLIEQLENKTEKEAIDLLSSYIQDYHQEHQKPLQNTLYYGQQIIDKNINAACNCMVAMINKPLYRENFTGYITTYPRLPYHYSTGSIWLYYNRSIKYYIGIFLHELLHFQFIHYYQDHPQIASLSEQEFQFLKESMTVILNEECASFLGKPDKGYKIHQDLRKDLLNFRKKNKDFDQFITYGTQQIKEYDITSILNSIYKK